MFQGRGARFRSAVAAGALTLFGVLAFSVPALGADPPPVPKPDPPPKANPPPPPAPAPQPPAPVAPAPAAPAPVAPAPVAPAPSVVHPTAAERRAAAEQRAAAKRRAQRKAARAAAAKKLAAAQRRERAQDVLTAGNSDPSSNSGLPFLLAAFGLALVLFGLALTPAWAVPWRRGARALEARREELGVMGATGVVATVVFFLLIEVTK